MTASSDAVADPEVRALVAEAIDATDRAFGRLFADARAAGELPPGADPRALARLAGATIHTLSIRARAQIPKAEILPIIDDAVATICGPKALSFLIATSKSGALACCDLDESDALLTPVGRKTLRPRLVVRGIPAQCRRPPQTRLAATMRVTADCLRRAMAEDIDADRAKFVRCVRFVTPARSGT